MPLYNAIIMPLLNDFCENYCETNSCHDYPRGRDILFRTKNEGVVPSFFCSCSAIKVVLNLVFWGYEGKFHRWSR